MNAMTNAYDRNGKRIVPFKSSTFVNQFDGYFVSYVQFSGTIDTPEEAQEMIDFFTIMKYSLKK